ncbi:MAG: type IX secretion system protein PorQ [Muribaculaceae bacterium]
MTIVKKIFFMLTLLLPFIANAQDGSTAYNFLDVTQSAKIYGLGGVNITNVTEDITATDQNPALMGPEMSGQVALSYMRYLGESNFAGIVYTHSSGESAAWAAGIQYFGYGSMKETDASGMILGDFSPQDINFYGAYSRDLSSTVRGAFKVKAIYSAYGDYSALALATDLGVNYYNDENDLSLSAVIANLGGQVKRFDESYDRLPIDVRLGWAQKFGSFPVRFSITAWNLTKWHLPYYDNGDGTANDAPELKDSFSSNLFRHLIFGAELSNEKIYFTAAYNYKTRSDMSTYSRSFFSGWSLGAGVNSTKFRLGLAFSQPHTGATTFMVNIGLNLSDITK